MTKLTLTLALALFTMVFSLPCTAAKSTPSVDFSHGPLKVSDNGRFLVHKDSAPFFYLADTGWMMFHRLSLKDTEYYLENRRAKGFNVIQAMVANNFDSITTPNADGEMMFLDNDISKPNEKYFKHIDNALDIALEKGMVICMVVVWGDLVGMDVDPANPLKGIINMKTARSYGKFLGARYKDRVNIIWSLGGDITPKGNESVWRELAAGLKEGDNGSHLMTYHPNGWASSADLLHKEAWLDFNMWQSGHSVKNVENYTKITSDYQRKPVKPIIDAEPPYENHPVNYHPDHGWFDDFDVRQAAYWSVFAGAFGHTYGCNDIWQFFSPDRKPLVYARTPWKEAIDLPGSFDMGHLRTLVESRPYLSRVPSQTVIAKGRGTGGDRLAGTKGDGYIMVYIPTGKPFTLNLNGTVSGDIVTTYWYNPREGTSTFIGEFPNGTNVDFVPPTSGRGNDWVLVADDKSKNYVAPGVIK